MINACCNLYFCFIITVHGDIRHLENQGAVNFSTLGVHGDIRHLEKRQQRSTWAMSVHGDIRHLERYVVRAQD